jgi:hypothetical protein
MLEAPEYYQDDTERDQPEEPEGEIEPTEDETNDAADKQFLSDY